MVIIVAAAPAMVLTVKVALVAPAGTVTLEGTLAAAVLLLESVTCAPAAGAGPLNVAVPVEDCMPAIIVAVLSGGESSVGGGGAGGFTVNHAALGSLTQVAGIMDVDDAE